MAYAPLPKLVPIGSPRVTEEITKTMYPELLQSEPVQRLLSQKNIIIKPVTVDLADVKEKPSKTKGKKKAKVKVKEEPPEPNITVSIVDNISDDEPLYLPPKHDGDPGIVLYPIKPVKRNCGHTEPCEDVVCDVKFQQCVDADGSAPMLASSIEESEINAPVSRHCDNPHCDALSIDHNRCRRVKISVNRCDKSATCDICGVPLKNRKTRIRHRNCKRKNEYRHNEISGAKLLKERMREREIQMMEALRMRKNEWLDPDVANDMAIEALKRSDELIVIPTTPVRPPSPQQIVIDASSANSLTSVIPGIPIVLPAQEQNIVINNQVVTKDLDESLEVESNGGLTQDNQYIITTVPQTGIAYPVNVNEWVVQQDGTALQAKPILMPIRVVPIANIKSEPSLLHQKQGIPRFCIIADNTVPMQSLVNIQTVNSTNSPSLIPIKPNLKPIKPAPPKSAGDKLKDELQCRPMIKYKARSWRAKRPDKKPFECTYCSKRFLTDWYFKMHVAKHTGLTDMKCEICETVFTSDSELKQHMSIEHKETLDKVEEDDSVECLEEDRGSIICKNCKTTFETPADMEDHSCLEINGNFSDGEIEEIVDEEALDDDEIEVLGEQGVEAVYDEDGVEEVYDEDEVEAIYDEDQVEEIYGEDGVEEVSNEDGVVEAVLDEEEVVEEVLDEDGIEEVLEDDQVEEVLDEDMLEDGVVENNVIEPEAEFVEVEELEVVSVKLNGLIKSQDENEKKEEKRSNRRKSKHSVRDDCEFSIEPELGSSTEEKRKRKSIHR